MSEKTIYTAQEVADILKISKNTVYEMIKRGELLAYKVGNKMRISNQEIDDYMKRSLNGQAVRQITAPGSGTNTRYDETVTEALGASPADAGFVVCGQDIALDVLVRYLQSEAGIPYVLRSYYGSYNGLYLLYQDKVHVASSHLWDGKEDVYNVPYVERMLPGVSAVILRLFQRMQGFYVPRGNPKNITGWQDLGRDDIFLINREKGSGTRVMLDERLRLSKLASHQVPGYHNECTSHLAAAGAVSRGEADFAMGNAVSARMVSGVEFIPLQQECYDLIVKKENWGKPRYQALYQIVSSEAFRRELEGLGSYNLSETGRIIAET
ncbi:substrate-binding domain-containing protein [Candidatus Formimonas warabiya]|uniref:Excisionase n=1 Tax=Formimonas warabiya TaxID=1761012 RepID=A0A3G1KT18_FORW1|nr:helix-turn-helix transcriptional regulator [Candidatus Formimonas warabiya]ATW25601.1 excisionase [Candidatus Formimonas warabiya]